MVDRSSLVAHSLAFVFSSVIQAIRAIRAICVSFLESSRPDRSQYCDCVIVIRVSFLDSFRQDRCRYWEFVIRVSFLDSSGPGRSDILKLVFAMHSQVVKFLALFTYVFNVLTQDPKLVHYRGGIPNGRLDLLWGGCPFSHSLNRSLSLRQCSDSLHFADIFLCGASRLLWILPVHPTNWLILRLYFFGDRMGSKLLF